MNDRFLSLVVNDPQQTCQKLGQTTQLMARYNTLYVVVPLEPVLQHRAARGRKASAGLTAQSRRGVLNDRWSKKIDVPRRDVLLYVHLARVRISYACSRETPMQSRLEQTCDRSTIASWASDCC